MPELRQDPATREWIVVSTERARRPQDFKTATLREPRAEHSPFCPFCGGNESQTPPETYALRTGPPDTPGWRVRVVPNKFPALVPAGDLTRRLEDGFFRKADGVGYHEVIVETPRHDLELATMDLPDVQLVVQAYRQRYCQLREDPRVEAIIIFRNHGIAAGTSLVHPHSQIIATPVVPNLIRERIEAASNYYDDTGRCLQNEILEKELASGLRIIDQNESFAAFHPFASRQPFETWVMPRNMQPSFGNITDREASHFASILKEALLRLHVGLNDPDFNFVIHTAPVRDEDQKYYGWYLQILPRMTTPAGFEIGSGMTINVSLPEQTAAFVRTIRIPEPAASSCQL